MADDLIFDGTSFPMNTILDIIETLNFTTTPPSISIYVLLKDGSYNVFPDTSDNIASLNAWKANQTRGYLQKISTSKGIQSNFPMTTSS